MPRITFYVVNGTKSDGGGKSKSAPSREAQACANIANMLFEGKSADYRIGVLAPFFDRVRVDVATLGDNPKRIQPGSILIEDSSGEAVAMLQGKLSVNHLVNGMLKALSASRIQIDAKALSAATASIKQISRLLDQLDDLKKQRAGIQTQIKSEKKADRLATRKAEEAKLAARIEALEADLAAARAALQEFQSRKPATL